MHVMGRGCRAAAGLALLACGAGEASPGLKPDAVDFEFDAAREPDAVNLEFDAAHAAPEPDSGPEPDAGPAPESPWAVLIAGCFSMGSPELPGAQPIHDVCLEGFQLSKTEVTNAEYQTCVDAGACAPPHYDDALCWVSEAEIWGQDVAAPNVREVARPVVCVDWSQARDYAAFAGGRLPTEAEWEYAAQSGGLGTVYPWGDAYPDCTYAVMTERGTPCVREHTAPPCSRTPGNTQQGACDLAGNVWEWVEDTWRSDYTGAPTDGTAVFEAAADGRVVRGGGWQVDNADYLRTRYRDDEPATIAYDFLGFRIVR